MNLNLYNLKLRNEKRNHSDIFILDENFRKLQTDKNRGIHQTGGRKRPI